MSGVTNAVMGSVNSIGKFVKICFDTVSSSLCTIHVEHHEIHEGHHFTCQDYDSSVDNASPKYWHLKAPDTSTRCHLVMALSAAGPGVIEFFENPTTTGDGSALTIHNNDRNNSNSAELAIYYDPTVTGDGTRLCVNVIGTNGATPIGGSGGNIKRENEYILKQNEQYIVKFTPTNDGTATSCCFEFYES